MLRRSLTALAVVFALTVGSFSSGCSSSPTIPGTEIPDTPEFRSILEVLERYRTGFVRKDAAAVLSTAHVTYHDEAGTDDPSDDLGYDELGPLLRRRMDQLDSVRFTMEYLDASVHGDRAVVRVWIDASYRLKPFLDVDGSVRPQPQYSRAQDFAEFELLVEGDTWLIVRGI
ncbi:MAG: hypothetical protein V3V08_24460 [Nannocystaceae bacterium]